MQIDSQHFKELSRYGIEPEHLVTDPCMNIYTSAYYLAIAFKKWGVTWRAVGAYNAGFRNTEEQDRRRKTYAEKNTEHLSKYKKHARAMKYVMPRQQHGRPVDEFEA